MSKSVDKVVCVCDESGVHYPCPVCGKLYDDELDAAMCCVTAELEEREE